MRPTLLSLLTASSILAPMALAAPHAAAIPAPAALPAPRMDVRTPGVNVAAYHGGLSGGYAEVVSVVDVSDTLDWEKGEIQM
ncbi:hypothetical protein CERZMDRAFT_102986 [Cercospora zeae-maydis SCOH1-5]|uniref:Uncharacterized protein n=1 Tax=Cercospora zeae-maydis SCOH1-5 TaxID=717836 RepID=A0A6A6EX73_9PEZI|nr:hypothetical protein CERZMDRAFT_102986 [Cercospora zeae-maydis SCOH1-5]